MEMHISFNIESTMTYIDLNESLSLFSGMKTNISLEGLMLQTRKLYLFHQIFVMT